MIIKDITREITKVELSKYKNAEFFMDNSAYIYDKMNNSLSLSKEEMRELISSYLKHKGEIEIT